MGLHARGNANNLHGANLSVRISSLSRLNFCTERAQLHKVVRPENASIDEIRTKSDWLTGRVNGGVVPLTRGLIALKMSFKNGKGASLSIPSRERLTQEVPYRIEGLNVSVSREARVGRSGDSARKRRVASLLATCGAGCAVKVCRETRRARRQRRAHAEPQPDYLPMTNVLCR